MTRREETVHSFLDFEIRSGGPTLLRRGRVVAAEPKVLEVLWHLVGNADRVVSKSELLEAVWPGLSVVDGVVHRCISQARRVIGDDARRPAVVVTRGRRGYQLAAEVTTWRSSASRARSIQTSDPTALSGFIGRAGELREIARALRELEGGGRGRALCIVAGPGMGKTRLLDVLVRDAEEIGLRVLRSPCREVAGAPAFHPWIRVLGDIAAGEDGSALLAKLGSAAVELGASVPGIAAGEPAAAPRSREQRRSRFLASAERLLHLAAEARPTVVVMDDLHCGDEATLAFWRMLVPARSDVPLLLVCAYRDAEARGRPSLAAIDADTFANDRVVRMALAGLSPAENELLLGPLLDRPSLRHLSARIHERSEGNPFFALELARSLQPMAGRLNDSERARAAATPEGIRAVVALRFETLGPQTREVLETAATIGREFDLAFLREVAGRSDDEIDDALDEAASAGIVASDSGVRGRFRFSHILVRDVLYDGSAPAARRRRHRRIAERMLARGADDGSGEHLADLAHHFLEAAPDGTAEEACEYALRAADLASQRHAFEDAARCFEGARSALSQMTSPSPVRTCSILLDTADAWNRAGNDALASAVYREAAEIARTLGDGAMLARAAIGLTVRFGQPVDFGVPSELARDLLEHALAAQPEPGPTRAVLLACLSFSRFAAGAVEEAADYAARGLAAAKAIDDAYSTSVALVASHLVSLDPADPSRATRIVDELIEVASSSALPEMVVVGHTYRAFRCLEDGTGAEELDAVLAARSAVSAELRHVQTDWWSHVLAANVAMMRGNWQVADAESRAARDLAFASSNTNQDLAYRTQQAQVLIHRGDFEALLALSAESCQLYPHLQGTITAHRAMLAAVGERVESAKFAQKWHGIPLADALQPSNWLLEAVCLAEIAYRLDDQVLAESVYDFLEPCRDRNVIVGLGIAYNGPVSRVLGMLASVLGRKNQAAAHFEHALARTRDFRADTWLARTQIDYAIHLRRHAGDRTVAAKLLADAAGTSRRIGAVSLQVEIGMIEGAAS
jgi:DNA-binding winged helix-turn-helix (wHTH) protein/tetratricopeptide (TPR) repeat protein